MIENAPLGRFHHDNDLIWQEGRLKSWNEFLWICLRRRCRELGLVTPFLAETRSMSQARSCTLLFCGIVTYLYGSRMNIRDEITEVPELQFVWSGLLHTQLICKEKIWGRFVLSVNAGWIWNRVPGAQILALFRSFLFWKFSHLKECELIIANSVQ